MGFTHLDKMKRTMKGVLKWVGRFWFSMEVRV